MKRIYTIGRDPQCDIIIQDMTDVVSRVHAVLKLESNGKMFIKDQSKNGTYIMAINIMHADDNGGFMIKTKIHNNNKHSFFC